MIDLYLSKNEFENTFFISNESQGLVSDIDLSITISNKKHLNLTFTFSGTDWIFANGIHIKVDNYKWKKENLIFTKDHSGGTVVEWVILPVKESESTLINKIVDSKNTTIKFIGKKSPRYLKLNDIHKGKLKRIMDLYKKLK